jgi:hypothetical protein
MVFDFTDKGRVCVSMPNQIQEAIEAETVKLYKTLARNDIVTRSENDEKVVTKRESIWFHSKVAKLLYISKRTRPDILFSVSILSSRVSNPSSSDLEHLRRILGYLNNTKEKKLVLKPYKDMQLLTHTDASHAIHWDIRGHTGVTSTLGEGAIYAKSTNQNVNTRSTTETELVAVDESLPSVVCTRNLLISLGYPQSPSIIFQDNKSTMLLAEKGHPCSKKTKHIDMRFFQS